MPKGFFITLLLAITTNAQDVWHYQSVIWTGTPFPGVVAVGGFGSTAISRDGIAWQKHRTAGKEDLSSVAWTGSRLIAVGFNGVILTSEDGIVWTPRNSGTTKSLRAVVWAGAEGVGAVAVGHDGTLLTSPDGLEWKSQSSGVNQDLVTAVWSGSELFVASEAGYLIRSGDGKSWQTLSAPGVEWYVKGLQWKDSLLYFVGGTPAIGRPTPEGIEWGANRYLTPFLMSQIWAENQWIGVGSKVYLSSDGANWTERDPRFPTGLNSVTWTGSLYVVVGGFGLIATSADGSNWIVQENVSALSDGRAYRKTNVFVHPTSFGLRINPPHEFAGKNLNLALFDSRGREIASAQNKRAMFFRH